jgi:hypothetical protein
LRRFIERQWKYVQPGHLESTRTGLKATKKLQHKEASQSLASLCCPSAFEPRGKLGVDKFGAFMEVQALAP